MRNCTRRKVLGCPEWHHRRYGNGGGRFYRTKNIGRHHCCVWIAGQKRAQIVGGQVIVGGFQVIVVHCQCGRKHFVQRQHSVYDKMEHEIIEWVQVQRRDLSAARVDVHNIGIEHRKSATVQHLFGFGRQCIDRRLKFYRFREEAIAQPQHWSQRDEEIVQIIEFQGICFLGDGTQTPSLKKK